MDFPKVLCLSSPEAEIAQVFQVWNICRSRFQQKKKQKKQEMNVIAGYRTKKSSQIKKKKKLSYNDLHSEIYLISHVMQ